MKNLLILEFGLSLAFPTVLIPALSGVSDDGKETLHVSAVDASWLGIKNRKIMELTWLFMKISIFS